MTESSASISCLMFEPVLKIINDNFCVAASYSVLEVSAEPTSQNIAGCAVKFGLWVLLKMPPNPPVQNVQIEINCFRRRDRKRKIVFDSHFFRAAKVSLETIVTCK